MKPFVALGIVLAVLTASITSCDSIQTENSFSGDRYAYSSVSGSAEFKKVNAVIRQECASCHAVFVSYSEADFVANNLITPGSPQTSMLYSRLRGSNVGGYEDMPPTTTLSEDQLTLFYDWISGASN